MKILIVENELYLAQSISVKLTDIGYICEIASNTREAVRKENFDAILLSTNISGQNFYPVIEKHKNSIIIMMITYISNDTISNPIRAGASDYILKPFMIEELIRKLKHLKYHRELIQENKVLNAYVDYGFSSVRNEISIDKKISAPILIKSAKQSTVDAIIFNYAKRFGDFFEFISLKDEFAFEKIAKTPFSKLLYLIDLQNLKINEKEKLFTIIEQRRAVVTSLQLNESFPYASITVDTSVSFLDNGEVLSVENYIKHVLIYYQSKLTDSEIGKKLGMSRKSVWERRKKYGIKKK